MWAICTGVFVTHPTESAALVFGAVKGTGQWTGYQMFADCEEAPPLEWMEPKPCPPTDADELEAGADLEDTPGPDLEHQPAPAPEVDDGQAPADDESATYVIDGDGIRSVLDAGTDYVLRLHNEVSDAQHAGGFSVQVGHPETSEGAGS